MWAYIYAGITIHLVHPFKALFINDSKGYLTLIDLPKFKIKEMLFKEISSIGPFLKNYMIYN